MYQWLWIIESSVDRIFVTPNASSSWKVEYWFALRISPRLVPTVPSAKKLATPTQWADVTTWVGAQVGATAISLREKLRRNSTSSLRRRRRLQDEDVSQSLDLALLDAPARWLDGHRRQAVSFPCSALRRARGVAVLTKTKKLFSDGRRGRHSLVKQFVKRYGQRNVEGKNEQNELTPHTPRLHSTHDTSNVDDRCNHNHKIGV